MNIKLLTEHHLGFLSLKMGRTGLSESTLVKMSHCWKSYVTAQIYVKLSVRSHKANSSYIFDRGFFLHTGYIRFVHVDYNEGFGF